MRPMREIISDDPRAEAFQISAQRRFASKWNCDGNEFQPSQHANFERKPAIRECSVVSVHVSLLYE